MITQFSQLDPNARYSYADYLTWLFEERVELIRGQIYPIYQTPGTKHQLVLSNLMGNLFSFFKQKNCELFSAPFDVRLFDKKKSILANEQIFTVVQPDLCIVCNADQLDEKGCLGAPNLVIEILSKGNSKKEMRTKLELYEENEIQEYWIADPEHQTIQQFTLNEAGRYTLANIYVTGDWITSEQFPELSIAMDEIFEN